MKFRNFMSFYLNNVCVYRMKLKNEEKYEEFMSFAKAIWVL